MSHVQEIPTPGSHTDLDTRTYSMADVRACGDLKAAILLGQLRYWWPRKYANHRGVKKSVSDWERELTFGRDEVLRINKILVKCGMVEIYKDTWGHYKSESTFYVLTVKALAVKPLVENPQVLAKHIQETHIYTESTKTYKEEETKPVTASPVTVPADISIQPGKNKTPTPETGKTLAWGTTFENAVAERFGKPAVTPTKAQRKILNKNLKDMCRRLLASDHRPEQVHEFLRWVGGDGWMTLRLEWGPVYHPAIHAKEQAPWAPDLAWLVGSKEHGTGAHRLEAALEIWRYTKPKAAKPTPAPAPEPKPTHAECVAAYLKHIGGMPAPLQCSPAPLTPETSICTDAPASGQAATEAVSVSDLPDLDDDPYAGNYRQLTMTEVVAMLEKKPAPPPKPIKKLTCIS